jgi:hypothetical protein
MRRAILFTRIERYAKVVKNLTIILGIVGGVVSLLAAQYDKRVAKTLELSKLYNEGVRKDYLILRSRWDEHVPADFHKLDEAKQKDLIIAFFKSRPNQSEKEKVSNHDLLTNIVDFFDMLGICITHQACDRNSAIDFFASSGQFTFDVAAFYIFKRRKDDPDPDFGMGLESFWRLKRQCMLAKYF